LTFPLTELKDQAPEDIMEKVIDFLRDGISSKEVYLRAFSCAGCGYCSDVCPQGIDPLQLHEAIKIELLEHGENGNPTLVLHDPAHPGDRIGNKTAQGHPRAKATGEGRCR